MAKLVFESSGVCGIEKFLEIVFALAHTRYEMQKFEQEKDYCEKPLVNDPFGFKGYPYVEGCEIDITLMETIYEVGEDLKVEAYFEADEKDGREYEDWRDIDDSALWHLYHECPHERHKKSA